MRSRYRAGKYDCAVRHTEPGEQTSAGPTVAGPAGGPPVEELATGHIVAKRYRIVSLLGRGGMGEVYRADDLILGSPVALKFLPVDLAHDPARVQALKNEVRVARQVSHPNVCRVHDFGEADGRPFVAMEYIDGEDLSKLLQRIGRLPREKALEIGREICRGLASVHGEGLVHRDLKPANVMLDGRGRVRLTDFGIAALRDPAAEFAGTPAYMAPELFDRHSASGASDVFSLGLVLYEMFTGQRAIRTDTVDGIRRWHRERGAEPFAGSFAELDPDVEAVVRLCLHPDPAARPSALGVAAALPGGDALQAALAAGQTPSPQEIASAARSGSLHRPLAVACLAAVVVLMVASYLISSRVSMTSWRPLPESPAALQFEVREHLQALGVTGERSNWASGFDIDMPLLDAAALLPPSQQAEFLRSAPTSPLIFWYRTRRDPLVPLRALRPTRVDPPPTYGDVSVTVNPDGSLISFHERLPRTLPASPPVAPSVKWRRIFALAALDFDSFEAVAPRVSPDVAGDARLAWIERAGGPLGPRRVEASLFRDRLVSLETVYERALAAEPGIVTALGGTIRAVATRAVALMWDAALFIGVIVAWRQLRSGRADLRGAARLALALLMLTFASHLLGRERLFATLGDDPLFRTLPIALGRTALIAVFYLAVEPFIRRHAPHQFIGWSRLLDGRLMDPLVGRDMLVGSLAGLIALVIAVAGIAADIRAVGPAGGVLWAMEPSDAQRGVGILFAQVSFGVALTLVLTLVYAGALSITGRAWIAATVLFVVTSGLVLEAYSHWSGAATGLLALPVFVTVLLRLGTLATAASISTFYLFAIAPVSDPSSWRFSATLVPGLLVFGLAVFGFLTASGIGQKRFTAR